MYKHPSIDQIVKQMSLSIAANEAKKRALAKFNSAHVVVSGKQIPVTQTLIAFLNVIRECTDQVAILDVRGVPVIVNPSELLPQLISVYFAASNQYVADMAEINRHRTVQSLLGSVS